MTDVQSSPMPRAVDEISAAWLTRALSGRFPGVEIAAVGIDEVLHGTATKVLARLTYGGAGQPAGAPSTVCVKGAFGEDNALMASRSGIYEREALFYRDMEPFIPKPGATSWFAETEPGTGFGVVVLEDMRASDARFGRPTTPLTIDQVAAGLEVIAGYHASTWAAPWLYENPALGPMVSRTNQAGLSFASHDVEYYLALPLRSAVVPDELRPAKLIIDLFWAWVDQSQDGPHCLSHGDAHMGNWYVLPNGRLGLVDWQTVCRTRWAHDVSYFVGSALAIDDRRTAERDLLHHYLDRLAGTVPSTPSWDEAWVDYRRHMAYGLMAWLTSREWMNPEDIHAASIGRFAQAVLDLDTAATLRP